MTKQPDHHNIPIVSLSGKFRLSASDHPTASLAGQFVLSAGDRPMPSGWTVLSHGGWTLGVHPALPHRGLVMEGGRSVGCLLGHVIDRDGKISSEPMPVQSLADWDATCEQIVGGLSGRFLLLILDGAQPRVYTDAFAMLAAVYAPSAGIVASTSALIPLTESTDYAVERILATDIPNSNAMYPLGLTPRRGVERVLPNHYLDLTRWCLVRRWPKGDLPSNLDPAVAVRRVAAIASRTIEGVVRAYPVQSPITAGRDSRLMLACSRNLVNEMTFFTSPFPGQLTGWRDVTIAKQIAARFGLTHTVLKYRRSRKSDFREWAEKTSNETGELTGRRVFRTLKTVSPERATLVGWSGDIVRPVYWKKRPSGYVVTVADVLEICGVPHFPEFVSRVETWLESLPTRNAITTLDLLLAEQRGGCWAGVVAYPEEGYALARLAPLCNEEIIRTLMCLPAEYRREMVFERDVIAHMWPELLEFPFNEQVPVSAVRNLYFDGRTSVLSGVDRVRRVIRRASRRLGLA